MDREGHVAIEELLLGYSMPGVDRFVDDIEALRRHGPSHRIFRHSTNDIAMVKFIAGKEAGRVALLHVLVDLDLVDRRILEFAERK